MSASTTRARSTSARASALLLAAAPAVLAGCGFHNLRVRHFTLGEKVPLQAGSGLSRVYAVMRLPEAPSPVLGGEKGGLKAAARLALSAAKGSPDAVSRPLDRQAASKALGRLAAALRTPYSGTAGFQIVTGDAPPALLARLEPSAVLWLKPSELRARRTLRSETVERRSKQDGAETVERSTKTVAELEAAFTMAYELRSWPAGTLLASGEYPASATAKRDGEAGLADWLGGAEPGLASAWVDELARDLLPHPVDRTRQVRKGRSEAMKAAFKACKSGDWEKARSAWEALSEADWEAASNLGVEAERRGDFAAAAPRYRSALERADNEGARRDLRAWLADLERAAAMPAPVTGARPDWYGQVAVLPFSNQSIDPEAADFLRKLVRERVERSGYKTVPTEELDGRLRLAGASQGEHLAALGPGVLAGAAQARLLLHGDVEEFGMVNAGVYQRKLVRVALKLTDPEGRELWAGRGEGFVERAADLRDAGGKLLAGLGEKLLERAFRVHLKDEAERAAAVSLESLPALPAAP